jgi:hypothetical protein
LAGYISAAKAEGGEAPVLVILDYYWCELHYYKSNYGMGWLSDVAYDLLSAGAEVVLLPYDAMPATKPGQSDMTKMLAGPRHPGIDVQLVQGESNPLWLASCGPHITEALSSVRGGDSGEQTRRWLHHAHPFVQCKLACPVVGPK